VRQGKWKLHFVKKEITLYDLSQDPEESHDLSKQYVERVQAMKKAHEDWLSEMKQSEQENKISRN